MADVKAAAYTLIRVHGKDAVRVCEETIKKLNSRKCGAGVWPEILIAIRQIEDDRDSDHAA